MASNALTNSDDERRAFNTAEIAQRLGGRLAGSGDLRITGVAALNEASPEQITFIADDHHARLWGASLAGAALVNEGLKPADHDPESRAVIYVPDAELALAAVLGMFQTPEPEPGIGVHPTACVDESAVLGLNVRIGPHVWVDRDCRIGDGVVLHAGVRLYAKVVLGTGCVLHANCVVRSRCQFGRNVLLHQNVSIGADGFGYRPAGDGGGLVKMPHIGTVVIEDDVEIGAGSCVDRAKFGQTIIGAGTKIDNLVQIAHNCRIGRCCVIAGLTGIAGSTEVGDGAVIAGAVVISDHIRIGRGVTIGGHAGVMNDIPDGETWMGNPAAPARETMRQWATIRKLPKLIRQLTSLAEAGQQHKPPSPASD